MRSDPHRHAAAINVSAVPFLPVRDDFHPKRNQARQKLATLPTGRFKDLSSDVYYELGRRYPEFKEEVVSVISYPRNFPHELHCSHRFLLPYLLPDLLTTTTHHRNIMRNTRKRHPEVVALRKTARSTAAMAPAHQYPSGKAVMTIQACAGAKTAMARTLTEIAGDLRRTLLAGGRWTGTASVGDQASRSACTATRRRRRTRRARLRA